MVGDRKHIASVSRHGRRLEALVRWAGHDADGEPWGMEWLGRKDLSPDMWEEVKRRAAARPWGMRPRARPPPADPREGWRKSPRLLAEPGRLAEVERLKRQQAWVALRRLARGARR